LHHIVLGAGLHAVHPLLPLPARRENEDRGVPARLAPALEDGQTVYGRKSELADDRVSGVRVAPIPDRVAIALGLDEKAGRLESIAQRARDPFVVLGDQYAHQSVVTFLPDLA